MLLDEKKSLETSKDFYLFPSILKTFVPHFGHSPFNAFLPFFMVTSLPFFTVTLPLHFIHLASTILKHLQRVKKNSLFSQKLGILYKCFESRGRNMGLSANSIL